jgi:hypothetical protein
MKLFTWFVTLDGQTPAQVFIWACNVEQARKFASPRYGRTSPSIYRTILTEEPEVYDKTSRPSLWLCKRIR